jgi:hypothetical protein
MDGVNAQTAKLLGDDLREQKSLVFLQDTRDVMALTFWFIMLSSHNKTDRSLTEMLLSSTILDIVSICTSGLPSSCGKL